MDMALKSGKAVFVKVNMKRDTIEIFMYKRTVYKYVFWDSCL